MERLKAALECVECRKRPSYEDAAGWQAHLVGDPDVEDETRTKSWLTVPTARGGSSACSPWIRELEAAYSREFQ
jgi:hypothetical protein